MNRESKAKHTQGEWKVKSGDTVSAVYANGRQVTFIAGAREEHLANARLIAAAPSMYEILRDLHDLHDDTEVWSHLFPSQQERIEELIKKIEG